MSTRELKKIFYVDDEPDIQTVGRMALETVGGFTVESCDSGREALEKLPAFAPDLIILDVMMPGMDGPETFRRLREIPALDDVPVVFFTAKAQASELAALRDLGAIDVLTKPFDPMRLSDDIRKIWHDNCHELFPGE